MWHHCTIIIIVVFICAIIVPVQLEEVIKQETVVIKPQHENIRKDKCPGANLVPPSQTIEETENSEFGTIIVPVKLYYLETLVTSAKANDNNTEPNAQNSKESTTEAKTTTDQPTTEVKTKTDQPNPTSEKTEKNVKIADSKLKPFTHNVVVADGKPEPTTQEATSTEKQSKK